MYAVSTDQLLHDKEKLDAALAYSSLDPIEDPAERARAINWSNAIDREVKRRAPKMKVTVEPGRSKEEDMAYTLSLQKWGGLD